MFCIINFDNFNAVFILNHKIMKDYNPTSLNAKITHKQNVPASDINFGAVATSVSTKWTENKWLTIKWLTAEKFATDAASYNEVLNARLNSGASRPQISKNLINLEKQMDDALSYVKGYITEKYKKENAVSYYPAFGIEHRSNRYIFPTDRNARLNSLTLMIEAIKAHEFSEREYGLDFWDNLHREFNAHVAQSAIIDGQISVSVGDKNVLKNNLRKGLNAVIGIIKANYPDTYKQELRDWGFQKEKY